MKDFLFHFLAWILSLPLLVMAVVFAMFNREQVAVVFSPLHPAADVPLYLPVLIGAVAGVFFGALMTWAAGARQRSALRARKKEIKQLNARIDQISARSYNAPQNGPQQSGVYHNNILPTSPTNRGGNLLEKK